MREIYFEVTGKQHSLYDDLIRYPPDGYNFNTLINNSESLIQRILKINGVTSFLQEYPNKLIPINLTKSYIEKNKKITSGFWLTYSTGHVIFRSEPWITDLEHVLQFFGWNSRHLFTYKNIIEKKLSSTHCKKIIPWTDAGTKTLLENLDCKRFIDKIETIHLAVHKKEFKKRYSDNRINLLFVASANFPKDFDIKGGKEVLAAFEILNKKYDNLNLIMRTYIPRPLKSRYNKYKNILIIDTIIPWSQLENEFIKADIFLFPAHHTPGKVLLDAMSYQLPVITTNLWANSEMINDGINGFLIDISKNVTYFSQKNIPNWGTSKFFNQIKNIDPIVVNDIVEKTSILIDDKKLRDKMGLIGRDFIENGKFSIQYRNNQLKKIFDEIIQ
jgi:glycosyltransferase involved in cell wall biosynthesis